MELSILSILIKLSQNEHKRKLFNESMFDKRQEQLNNYWASLKEKAKQNYEKNKEIYFEYKNDRKALIALLKTVQDIRQIKDCGKLADELLNIEVASKKNRMQKRCRLFVERLNAIVNPKININKVVGKNTIYDIVYERWYLDRQCELENQNNRYNIVDIILRPYSYLNNLSNLVSSMLEYIQPSGYYPIFWNIKQILSVEEAGKMIKIRVETNKESV